MTATTIPSGLRVWLVQVRSASRHYRLASMNPDRLGLLHDVADAVAAAFRKVSDFGPSGGRDGQYALDLVADEAALAVLRRPGWGCCRRRAGSRPAVLPRSW